MRTELKHGSALSFQDVLNTSDWQRLDSAARLGFVRTDTWLRYSLPGSASTRIFSVNNPWLYRFDLYLVSNGELVSQIRTGSARPLASRPLQSSVFAVPVGPEIDTVYLHDYGESASNFPVSLTSASDFSSYNAGLNVFHGFYWGLVLIMVLYNFALYLGSRDSAYGYYSAYALSLMVFLAAADGSGSLLLWSDIPRMQYVVAAAGWGAAFVTLIEFLRRFLKLDQAFRRVARMLHGAIILTTLALLTFPNSVLYAFQTALSGVAIMLIFAVAARAALRNQTEGYVFLVAHSIFTFSVIVHVCMLLGWIDSNAFVHHSMHVGSMLELSILAVALGMRVREAQTARFEAIKKSQQLTRHNIELQAAKRLTEEHRQLQKSLQQAQKLKTIGQLAGGFAHDFNNILASMIGFAELAQQPQVQASRGKLSHYLQQIVSSGERGAELVKQLLVYSRNTPPSVKRLDMVAAVRDAEALIQGSLPSTVQLSTNVPDSNLYLQSDPEQLQQVLVNLCLNAAEATDNRGEIEITLSAVDSASLTCSSCLQRFQGEFIQLRVEDNGPGFSGDASQLFTPFHTTKAVGQGTGLGLSVVHGIVHEHGGHIHASNRASGGARFNIYLPLSPPALGYSVPEQPRILVIEDDPSVASYLEALLQGESFHTTLMELPTEALEQFVADPYAFDLIITDNLMPNTTGIELAEDIHALRPELPVVLVTGTGDGLAHSTLAQSGVNAVFPKPLNAEGLLAKIRALLAT